MQTRGSRWEQLAERPRPSWYLDRLVAEQKRELHQQLIRNWTSGLRVQTVLKTDLFEEAHGPDQILFDLFPDCRATIGIDVSPSTACRARRKCPLPDAIFIAADVRGLPLRSDLADVIISNSTLDHFDTAAEFRVALQELARTLRAGGLLIVTMDNPLNPLYQLLRWLSRRGLGPFTLGYTTSQPELVRSLEAAGLEVISTGALIHNPRVVSTLLFLGLRRLLGRHADGPIRRLLELFATLERLPTRRFTACFVAACARKPAQLRRCTGQDAVPHTRRT